MRHHLVTSGMCSYKSANNSLIILMLILLTNFNQFRPSKKGRIKFVLYPQVSYPVIKPEYKHVASYKIMNNETFLSFFNCLLDLETTSSGGSWS